jgi:Tol biopolymer transport system component
MDPDGGRQMQLTFGTRDSNWPRFTPDSRYVVYHHSSPDGMWNLWRVPTAGGTPERLTTKLTMHPAVSPKDGRLAAWYSEDSERPRWNVAIFAPQGGAPLQVLDVPGTLVPDTALRWTPAGDAITYVDTRGGASNVWVHPIDGSPRKPLTTYNSGQIYSFDWSKDDRLAYSKGMSTSDVVLIRDLGSR